MKNIKDLKDKGALNGALGNAADKGLNKILENLKDLKDQAKAKGK